MAYRKRTGRNFLTSFDPRKTLNKRQFEAIGRIVACGTDLEYSVKQSIVLLCQIPGDINADPLLAHVNVHTLLDIMLSMGEVQWPEETAKKLRKLVKRIKAAVTARNNIVHSLWPERFVGSRSGQSLRLQVKARGKLKWDLESLSATEINKRAMALVSLRNELSRFFYEHSPSLNVWPEESKEADCDS